jgi:NAD(P)-dependent dehydrogenase (short-subunit alcohol dehydrogenase family)
MSQRVALITGAGTGVGRAAALALLRDDFRVFLVGRRDGPLAQTKSDVEPHSSSAIPVQADVSDPASVDKLFSEVRSQASGLDFVRSPRASFDELTFEQWNRVIAINLTGAFLVAGGTFRLMKSQSPREDGSLTMDLYLRMFLVRTRRPTP